MFDLYEAMGTAKGNSRPGFRDLYAEMGGLPAPPREFVTPDYWEEQLKPSLIETGKQIFEIPKSLGEVGLAAGTGALGWLVGSGLGIAESLKPGSTRESVRATAEDAAGRLAYQPRTQPAQVLMEKAGRLIEAGTGPAKEAAALVGESWDSPFLESVLRFAGEMATFEAAGMAGRAKPQVPLWYRKMTVKERGLVEGIKADLASGEFTGAELRELWKDPTNRESLLKRYQGVGEEGRPSRPAFREPPSDKALPEGQGFELRPTEAEIRDLYAEMGEQGPPRLPPGQGFELGSRGAKDIMAEMETPGPKALPYPEGIGDGFTFERGEVEAPIVTKAGQPFRSERTATQAGKGLDWNLYEVTPQGEGFAITRKMGRELKAKGQAPRMILQDGELVEEGTPLPTEVPVAPSVAAIPMGATKAKGPEGIIGRINQLGGLNVYDDYNAPEMRQFPDMARVMKKAGLKPDDLADQLNGEGYNVGSGDDLLELLKAGGARNVFTPGKAESIIERKLRGQENEWISQQLADLEIRPDSVEISEIAGNLKTSLHNEIKAEGFDILDEEAALKEINSFFDEVAAPTRKGDVQLDLAPTQGQEIRTPSAPKEVPAETTPKASPGDQEILYHGTNAEYANADISTGKKMYGIHLTTDEGVAKDYGKVKKYVLSRDAKVLDLSDGDALWRFMEKEGILDAEDIENVDLERYTKDGQLFQYDISGKTHLSDDVAKTAESLGYDVVKMPDDLGGRGDNVVQVVVNKKVLQSPDLPNPSRPPEVGGQSARGPIGSERGSIPINESEILEAILKTQGKIADAMPHIEALGRSVYESGKTRFLDWQAAIKARLGDLWEGFKGYLRGVWDRLKFGEIGPLGNDRGMLGGDETGGKYNRRAINKYGVTMVDESTGYITRDGKKIDSSGKRQGSRSEGRNVDHREIAQHALGDESTEGWTQNMTIFMNKTGNIRVVNVGRELNIDVPVSNGMPSSKQLNILERMAEGKKVYYDFTDTTGRLSASGEGTFGKFKRDLIETIQKETEIRTAWETGGIPKQLKPLVDFIKENGLSKEEFLDSRYNRDNPLYAEHRKQMDATGLGVGKIWSDFGISSEAEFYDRVMGSEQKPGGLGNQKGAVGLDIGKKATKETKDILGEIKQTADEYLGAISTRLGNIDPSLKYTLRNFEFKRGMRAADRTKRVLPFIEKTDKIPAADKEMFDLARKNGNPEVLKKIVTKYGTGKEYHELRTVLQELHKEAISVGYDVGYQPNYHPRVLKDTKGFLEYFYQRGDWPVIQKAIREQEVKLQRYLSDDEKAKLINNMLRGYPSGQISLSKPGQLKAREIDKVTPELNQFYMDSNGALLRYISDVTDAIEARKLFGKGPKGGKVGNLDDTIGGYVLDLLQKGKIKPEQERVLRDILDARFNEVGTRGIFGLYKNLSYIDTMGSPISAVTQIGDLAWALYKSGPLQTAAAAGKAIAGKSLFKKEDIGIERIASEFADTSKAARAVTKVFRMTGLEKIDNIGKEALINSTYAKARQQAMTERGTAVLRKELEPIFEGETDQVLKDIRTGNITENVKLYLFNNLADFQPIALSEMPQKYLSGGNGRIFYMLKTFTLKQFDVYRREIFQKIAQEGTRLEGLKNLIYLTGAFVAANASADFIKDFILGRPVDIEDKAVDNFLRLLGISKFVTWKAREEGVGSAMVRQIAPPFKAADAISKDIAKAGDGKGLEITQSIPIVGKLYYWWFGKGAEKSARKSQGGGGRLVNPNLKGLKGTLKGGLK